MQKIEGSKIGDYVVLDSGDLAPELELFFYPNELRAVLNILEAFNGSWVQSISRGEVFRSFKMKHAVETANLKFSAATVSCSDVQGMPDGNYVLYGNATNVKTKTNKNNKEYLVVAMHSDDPLGLAAYVCFDNSGDTTGLLNKFCLIKVSKQKEFLKGVKARVLGEAL